MRNQSTEPSSTNHRPEEWASLTPSQGFAWTTPGTALIGVWMGSTTGEQGPRGVVGDDTSEGDPFSVPASLRQQVGDSDPGARCKITYMGDRVSRKTGPSYRNFTVMVWMGARA